MRKRPLAAICVALTVTTIFFLCAGRADAAKRARVPMVCTRGPDGQFFDADVSLPASATEGSVYVVRVDSFPSGKLSQTGLNYIHDLTTSYVVPQGATYVEGSARIVPGSGTDQVRKDARVTHAGGKVTMVLPAHINNGDSYTPPSFEVKLLVTAPAGTELAFKFDQYGVSANVFMLGNLRVTCDPRPRPAVLASTSVTAR
jgi:hypothetical protein